MACLFCDIAAGRRPSREVFSDDRVFAFHDIHLHVLGGRPLGWPPG